MLGTHSLPLKIDNPNLDPKKVSSFGGPDRMTHVRVPAVQEAERMEENFLQKRIVFCLFSF